MKHRRALIVLGTAQFAQLGGLKTAILATGGITLASFLVTSHLPTGRASRPEQAGAGAPADALGAMR
ncbi:hypothetical protein [Streptomyces sp. SD15]